MTRKDWFAAIKHHMPGYRYGRIILPVSLTFLLFVAALFLVVLPYFRENLEERKREMIRELTVCAWHTMLNAHEKEKQGLMTREEAQKTALEQIRGMRYGPEMKNYFWVNDMNHVLIMHPYRLDLEGVNMADMADVNGKLFMREFIKLVKRQGEGFVDYYWQWNDDPTKIVPKISYMKGFKPWDLVIGTGVY
ncbi:MAG: cache domain-containing protein, partial [Planctomycetes bacterium]|nr:cache domain-containing protein [Planctomycetota bacterium]